MTGPAHAGDLAARAAAWRAADPDPQTRAELDRLLADGDTAGLADRFEGSLAFGTAGIRAAMGAGPMRMNRLVTARVAAGLAYYIAARDPASADNGTEIPYPGGAENPDGPADRDEATGGTTAGNRNQAGNPDEAAHPDAAIGGTTAGNRNERGTRNAAGVVVGYDGRANSQVFATDAARILSRAGVKVSMLPGPLPTPVLAFAVRYERAAYGVMVTASHNPRHDNGIKVYVSDGGQLLPPVDGEIAAAIDAVDPVRLPAGWAEGSFDYRPADDAVDAYVTAVAAGGRRAAGTPELKVVHTALHGVGDVTLRRVLAAAGWPAPAGVAAQRQPDPAFPTLPYPNPEVPGVLDLARAAAEAEGADLVLANDPDADRLAVMVPGPDGWRALTGDELGALLGDAALTRLAAGRTFAPRTPADAVPAADASARTTTSAGVTTPRAIPADANAPEVSAPDATDISVSMTTTTVTGAAPVVATTVVSGSLLRRLADAGGVRCVTTLTGFKWIARAGGADGALAYGYEQALGYAVRPDLVADKDGISAALLALQVAAGLARDGKTLTDRLDDLALAYGVHVTRERSLRADGPDGLARLADAVERVRKAPPRFLAGQPVTVTDLLMSDAGVVDLAGGRAERAPGRPIPPADVLIWHAGAGGRLMIRPSGTEPVLKLYAETVWPARSRDDLAAARASATRLADTMLAAAAAELDPATDR